MNNVKITDGARKMTSFKNNGKINGLADLNEAHISFVEHNKACIQFS
jgi:hypothetical protein